MGTLLEAIGIVLETHFKFGFPNGCVVGDSYKNIRPSPQILRRTKSGTRIYHTSHPSAIALPASCSDSPRPTSPPPPPLLLLWTLVFHPTPRAATTPQTSAGRRFFHHTATITAGPQPPPGPTRRASQGPGEGRRRLAYPSHAPAPLRAMPRDRSPTAERRRGIRRLLLHPRGEASSSSPPPPPRPPVPAQEEGRRKGFASAALRGLGCASSAASQAYAPGAAAAATAVRSSADWHGGRRRRRGKDRRKDRGAGGGGGGGGGGGFVTGGIGADVWCAPGIPFAAEASSVDCVVARHQMVGRGGGRGADGDRPHREVCVSTDSSLLLPLACFDLFVLRFPSFVSKGFLRSLWLWLGGRSFV